MPCRTYNHPSEGYIWRVRRAREEGTQLIHWIATLSPRLKRFSTVFNKRNEILAVLSKPCGLKEAELPSFCSAWGTDDVTVVVDTPEHKRCVEACAAYRALHDRIVREMCTLCRISEKVPGRFLSKDQAQWWKDHKQSPGHITGD